MTAFSELQTPDRSARGHVIVLPGIEGYSRWNRGIVRGLVAAGVPFGMEIHDWTYGRWLSAYTLRAGHRHREQSALIAEKVLALKAQWPHAPVWLIGHSGGGAMSILTLERLAGQTHCEGAVLLAPALSPGYDLSTALSATRRGLWNFCSWGDVLFLMAGTLALGTLDGRHSVSAGACGFRWSRRTAPPTSARNPEHPSGSESPAPLLSLPPLTEIHWRREMLRCGNFAGHFGCVNQRFVRDWVAPILLGLALPSEQSAADSSAYLLTQPAAANRQATLNS